MIARTTLLALLICSYASLIHAYIPPVSFILQQMAQQYIKQNSNEQRLSSMIALKKNPYRSSMMVFNDQGVFYKATNEETLNEMPQTFLASINACRAKAVSSCLGIINDYLIKNAIDKEKVSLAIFDNEPAYIVGAQAGDTKSPQLWLNKDSYLPVKEQRGLCEITWKKWQSNNDKSFLYPRLITMKNDENIIDIANGESL